jgi:ribonuclease HI
VKHREIWQALVAAGQAHHIEWHCLKGEVRPAESQRADELARQAARQGA